MSLMGKFSALVFVVGLLSACTAFHPPGYNLPSKDSIVAGDEYTVGRNENVYAIAHKQGVSMRAIIALNDLTPPFILRPGQRLTLPAKDQDSAPTPLAAPRDAIDQTPLAPSSITSAPLDAPQTLPPNTLPPEAVASPQPAAPPVAHAEFAPTPLTPPPPPPAAPPLAAAKPIATTVTPEVKPEANPPEAAPQPATAVASVAAPEKPTEPTSTDKPKVSFVWPVQGPVVSPFGSKGQGLSNDGINITAPKGAPVVAAAGGIVVYAGNEMKGFGNLVLIRHEGGWVTAYAHLGRMMVAKDSVVAEGDMIGTVGTTGGVASPQLHFETRLDGKPIDPQAVIKK